MASFTAQDVKKLRDMTGAGMMDCKNALTETDGEFDAAIELLRIKSGAKLDKKAAERTAANGIVAASGSALVELKCETDFVAKNEAFVALANAIAATADEHQVADAATLGETAMADGKTVTEAIREAAATIGEKLELGRVAWFEGATTVYLHRKATDLPPQAGVLVQFTGENAEAARGAAMQAAAMRPQYLTRDEVPADVVETERRVAEAKSREEGKPEAALPKIIEGRVNGFFKEVVLLEQASVQDNKKSVKQLLDAAGVQVTGFAHIEVGG